MFGAKSREIERLREKLERVRNQRDRLNVDVEVCNKKLKRYRVLLDERRDFIQAAISAQREMSKSGADEQFLGAWMGGDGIYLRRWRPKPKQASHYMWGKLAHDLMVGGAT